MSGAQMCNLCVLVLFVYGVAADWQILNESAQDLSLRDDNLLPVPAQPRQPSLSRERSLTAQGQASSKNASHVTMRDLRLQQNQKAAPVGTGRVELTRKASLTRSVLSDPVSQSSPSKTTVDAQRDDLIDLAGEGLLLVDRHRGQPPAGHQPSVSRDVADMARERAGRADSGAVLGDVDRRADSGAVLGDVDRRAESAQTRSLSTACIQDDSWECQMFKQHFLAMQANMKLSPRASVYERSKRQASSNYNNVAVEARDSNWSSRNLLDCEDGECFSGNGTDQAHTGPNQDDIRPPVYSISQLSKFNTSLRIDDLTPGKRRELAQQLIDSLKITFGNFSGFKDIIINPDKIHFDGDVLVIPWNMTFDSGDPAYSHKDPKEIADIVRDSLHNLTGSYRNNVTVNGQHPIDDLNFEDAAQQVENQARDPCSSGSCQLGYDMCQAVNATIIRCIHNCNSRPTSCQHGGQCQLDSGGNAVCQCSRDYTGADCESEDSSLDAGQIAGIVAGSALIVGAVAGTACTMMMCARRRNKDVNFTEYSDEPSSDLASNPSNQLFMIDRPAFNIAPMSIHGQPARPHLSTPSSYAASNNSGAGHGPADEFNSRA